MVRYFQLAAAACIVLALTGCGIKGPLVPPPRPAAPASTAPPASMPPEAVPSTDATTPTRPPGKTP